MRQLAITGMLAMLVLLPVSVPAAAEPEPQPGVMVLGSFHECDGFVYQVVASSSGPNYGAWVLEMVGGSLTRMGWNNQLDQTQKAATVELDNGGVTFSLTTQISQTGPCGAAGPWDNGARPGVPNAYVPTIYFSGLTTTVTNTQLQSVTREYWAEFRLMHHSEGQFTLTGGLVGGWEEELSFGASYSHTEEYGTQVTQVSTLHVFSQPGTATW